MQHQGEESRSVKTIENRLTESRQTEWQKFTHIKNPHVAPNSIFGDSMQSGIEERKNFKKDRKIEFKYFRRTTIDDMQNYTTPLFEKYLNNV